MTSRACLDMSYFAMFTCFHFLKVSLRIKILHTTTSQTFFNGCTQCSYFLFLIFQ